MSKTTKTEQAVLHYAAPELVNIPRMGEQVAVTGPYGLMRYDARFDQEAMGAVVNPNDPDVPIFDLSWNKANKCPSVYCRKTNKHFLLEWRDIVSLAKAAGIEEPYESDILKKIYEAGD